MTEIYLSGVVPGNRLEQIRRIQELISAYGSIIYSRFFSDLSMSFGIEVNSEHLPPLYGRLETLVRMDELRGVQLQAGAQVTLYLHLYFAEGKGNLTLETPAVPG